MKALLAVVALAVGGPLAAQSATEYQQAVAARQAGDLAAALRLLDRWLAQHPADSDALVQRGYTHLALGDVTRAEADFTAALAIAPAYGDAREGLAIARARQADKPGGFLIAGGAFSALEGARADWWEAMITGEVPVTDRVAIGARANWFRRFDIENVEIEARVSAQVADNLWLRASIGGAPNADFRPEIAAALGADLRLADGPQASVISLDASVQRFPLQQVVTIAPGLTQYFGGGRWWATVRGIGIIPEGGALELGVLGRLDFAPGERERYFIGAVRGPDTEVGRVSRVTSLFAGAEVPLARRFSLLPSITREWREVGGNRTDLRVDLRVQF
ncbi:MAG: YaiO family outer membrane beta-barrel protein [Porphyrobacter sp.]|jgi:YaiO family outer membrane protein|nr:YaiO family outer membrane beta-barrel protein [Porphyrobacter sp.]